MEKKQQVRRIFDAISGKYDFLNHLLSAGIDFYWRKKALKLTKLDKSNSVLLDIACGTGDFSNEAKKQGAKEIFGADLSFNMLKIYNEKHAWSRGKLTELVAENLPFKNNYFTNITVAFGVRNFYSIPQAFKEFHRVLKDKGKVTILEFSLPKNPLVKSFYMFYFKHILPLVGKIISKDNEAYQYLPDSVQDFEKRINLPQLLEKEGFKVRVFKKLTFGIVQIVIAEK